MNKNGTQQIALRVRAMRCLRSLLDRHVLSDTDALRNPQRQLASDRYVGRISQLQRHSSFN